MMAKKLKSAKKLEILMSEWKIQPIEYEVKN